MYMMRTGAASAASLVLVVLFATRDFVDDRQAFEDAANVARRSANRNTANPSAPKGDESQNLFLFAVVRWPAPWPPPELTEWSHSSSPKGHIKILGTPDGNLVVLLNRGDENRTFISQPIAVINVGYKVLKIMFEAECDRLSVIVGSRPLAPLSESGDIFFLELATGASANTKSFNDEAAAAACAREIELRKNRYNSTPIPGDVPKSLREEIESLSHSLRWLEEDAARVRNGERHRNSSMRAALRELVVNLGSTYQPLLFRVADKFSLPLPIYAMPKGNLWSVFDNVEHAFEPSTFGITREFDAQVLVDFEEWVRRPVVRTSGRRQPFLFQDLIAKAAEFLGGAHAAPTVPEIVHRLSNSFVGGVDELTTLLLKVSAVVLELGGYVLSVAKPNAD